MTSINVLREYSTHLTFRSCVTCDTEPVCNCSSTETCVESSRTCTECPTVTCVPNTPPPSASGDGPNVGAIAGGVVGGLACIAIVTFLVWWFVIRKKRQEQLAAQSTEPSIRHERSRSMQSIASTVYTRASNVIQIAYIPGVTNRDPDTPGTLVPPVPAIPSAHASTYSNDQYLFTPRDLRDSRYTAATDRRSIATSLARSSVATTIYRHDAIVSPVPAQQVRAAKAAVVSVKTGNGLSSDTMSLQTIDAPAVPVITEAQLQKADKMKPQLSSIIARSVVARPVNVNASGSKPKVPTVSEEEIQSDSSELLPSMALHGRTKETDNQNSTFEDSSDDENDEEFNEKVTVHGLPSKEGPFSDSNRAGTPKVTITNATSSTRSTVNEGVPNSSASFDNDGRSSHRQSSTGSTRTKDATPRSRSPFDDKHEIQ